jgi:hypothetical protein
MRHLAAALAALTLIACSADEAPLPERVTFERIERSSETTVAAVEASASGQKQRVRDRPLD